jgi:hypothetical protein
MPQGLLRIFGVEGVSTADLDGDGVKGFGTEISEKQLISETIPRVKDNSRVPNGLERSSEILASVPYKGRVNTNNGNQPCEVSASFTARA